MDKENLDIFHYKVSKGFQTQSVNTLNFQPLQCTVQTLI